MDHESAIQTNAVERYLLGEMPIEERDSFEAHYFDCASCAEDIRLGSAMSRHIKAVLRQGIPSRSWFAWLRTPVLVPTFASVALLGLVGYQNLVQFPELRAPRPVGAPVILDGQTRSALPQVPAGDSLRFQMPLDEVTGANRLRVELLDASGQRRAYGEVPAPPAHQPLDVMFPVSADPGRYVLLVREAAGDKEVARNSFQVVPRQHAGETPAPVTKEVPDR
jgi:hypothetical protein